ncbi:hypothetical protein BASA83_012718 [Batrachochytrium salamandrivorans]|nr:hypothetical protein BASA83_012718 [Batrachochytrium salamandrivorans]
MASQSFHTGISMGIVRPTQHAGTIANMGLNGQGFVAHMHSQPQIETIPLAHSKVEPASTESRASDVRDRPLLILPGLFGSKQNWRSLSRFLAQQLGTTVVPLDMRNHGDSPHHPVHTYTAMCADVDAFVASQGWTSVNLLGHSMGGKVAMHAALLPGHNWLNKLVVVDMSPVAQTLSMSNIFAKYVAAMIKVDNAKVRSSAEADAILAEVVPEIPIRQFIMTNLKKQGDTYQFRINLEALSNGLAGLWSFDLSSDVHQFNGPTLFVAGGNSGYITPAMHPTIKRFFPASNIVSIADAGHWVHADKPEEFVKTVVGFLKSN